MIFPPTKAFFVIHTHGEVTDKIMSKLSPSTASDITDIIMSSGDLDDIQAHALMDTAVEKLKDDMGDIFIETALNPLYIPSTREAIDAVIDGDPSTDHFQFTAMGGDPFVMKRIDVSLVDEPVLSASVSCHRFPLPSYSEIIEAQAKVRPN